MADETNGAWITVTWNSITLHVTSIQLPTITRDDDVDNTYTGTSAFRAFVGGARATVGDTTVTAKFDAGTYESLAALCGDVANTKVTSSFVATMDSGAVVTITDMYLKEVAPDATEDGGAPMMTLVLNSEGATGRVAPDVT